MAVDLHIVFVSAAFVSAVFSSMLLLGWRKIHTALASSPVFLYIPNLLCYARLALGLALLPCYYAQYWVPFVACYALAALSDLADGILARKLGQQSRFGEWLDVVADKSVPSAPLPLVCRSLFPLARTVCCAPVPGSVRPRETTMRRWPPRSSSPPSGRPLRPPRQCAAGTGRFVGTIRL